MSRQPGLQVMPVAPREPDVVSLFDALTTELALSGYTADQTFGYSTEQLERSAVHLVGARLDARLVGVGGVELQGEKNTGELKRFYVVPEHRGAGVADAVLIELMAHTRERGITRLRLETGDRQGPAIAFYRRHGFVEVPRFGPYVHSDTSVCMQSDV